MMLSHLPGELLAEACRRAAALHQFPTLPPVGLILRAAADLAEPPLSAGRAWQMVREAINDRRARAALPRRVAAAAAAYGWRTLEDMPTVQMATAFAQFRGVYESIDGDERREDALPPSVRLPALAGLVARVGALPARRPRELPAAGGGR
jgi:hypothetical protein